MKQSIKSFLFVLCMLASCVAPGGEAVQLPVRVSGINDGSSLRARDGWSVTLSEARMVFGPLYLCPSDLSGAGCDVARAEMLQAVVVDLLDDAPQDAGLLIGQAGFVGGYWYDLGRSAPLDGSPLIVADAADELGGDSIVLVGEASKAGLVVPFDIRLALDLEGEDGTTTSSGTSLVRGRNQSVQITLSKAVQSLDIGFDVAELFQNTSFESALGWADACQGNQPACIEGQLNVCQDGLSVSESSCSGTTPLCAAGQCRSELSVDTTEEFAALRASISFAVVSMQPQFVWASL